MSDLAVDRVLLGGAPIVFLPRTVGSGRYCAVLLRDLSGEVSDVVCRDKRGGLRYVPLGEAAAEDESAGAFVPLRMDLEEAVRAVDFTRSCKVSPGMTAVALVDDGEEVFK